jgi:hypothetical protein
MLSKLSNFAGPSSNIFGRRQRTVLVGDSIYDALSTEAQDRYVLATVGHFINVSESDYDSVLVAISATKYIMDDTDLKSSYIGWSAGFNVSYHDTINAIGSIPTNNYVIGYAWSGTFYNNTVTTYLRTGRTPNGSFPQPQHSILGNTINFNPGSGEQTVYFIRRAPTTPSSTKLYVSFYASGSSNLGLGGIVGNYPIYYSPGVGTNNWTFYTTDYPILQVAATSTKLW